MTEAADMDVAAWLRGLGLERYEAAFRDNDVDAEVLPRLNAEDLGAIGVSSIGHRRRLLDAIAVLRDQALTADRSGDVLTFEGPRLPLPDQRVPRPSGGS